MERAPSRGTALAAASVLFMALAALALLLDRVKAAVFLMCVAQSLGVLWLGVTGWHRTRQWATAQVVLAAAWALTFLVPCWLYAFDFELLDVSEDPARALATVNLSLFALVAGVLAYRRLAGADDADESPARISIEPGRWSPPWLYVWAAVGLVGIALLFRGAGGPVEYVTNLDQEGRLNTGRVYIVWMALFVRYAAQIALCRRWAAGEGATRWLILAIAGSIGLTALIGARLFVAVAIVELVLFYALVRRPIPFRALAPAAALIACVVILLGGAAKRYQNYVSANTGPDKPFAEYLTENAPDELAPAYANNYADGVRLFALAQVTVPRYGGYEYGKLGLRYVAQPIPRSRRPEISRSRAIERAMFPSDGTSHAIPLQVSTYLQGGLAVVVLAFLLLGAGVAWLDRRLLGTRRGSFTRVVFLTSVAVAVPSYLRSSEAGGLALAAIDVVGLTLVAFTAEGGARRLRARLEALAGRAPNRARGVQ